MHVQFFLLWHETLVEIMVLHLGLWEFHINIE